MAKVKTLQFEEIKEDLWDNDNKFDDLDFVIEDDQLSDDVLEGLVISSNNLSDLGDDISDASQVLEDMYELKKNIDTGLVSLPAAEVAVESLMSSIGYRGNPGSFTSKSIARESIGGKMKALMDALINAIKQAIKWIKDWFIAMFKDRTINSLKKEITKLIDKAGNIDFEGISKDPVVYPVGIQSLLVTTGDKYFNPAKVDEGIDKLIRFVIPDNTTVMSIKAKLEKGENTTITKMPFGNISLMVNRTEVDKFRMILGKDIDHNYVSSINDIKPMTRIELDKSKYLTKLHNLNKLIDKLKEYSNHASQLSTKLENKARELDKKYEHHLDKEEVKNIKEEIDFNIQILTNLYPKLTHYTVTVVKVYVQFLKVNLK